MFTYLDDWLQPPVSERLPWQHSKEVLGIILSLGFIPNRDKSKLVPVQSFSFLGARLDLVLGLVGPSLDRIVKFHMLLANLSKAKQSSARQIYSVLG